MPGLYAEILVPRPLDATFTYEIPPELITKVNIGHRVIVPFGVHGYLTGIVTSTTHIKPEGYALKQIVTVLDDHPIVRYPQIKLWQWIADYYMCAIGDVYKAAIPAGLKIESETFIEYNPDYEPASSPNISERELIISEYLKIHGRLTVYQLEKQTGLKGIAPAISRMVENGILIISEKIVERYRPIKIQNVRPTFDNAKDAFKAVSRSSMQEKMLLSLIELSGYGRKDQPLKEVSCQALINRSECPRSILTALKNKGLVEIYSVEINRFKFDGSATISIPELSVAQQKAHDEILQQWTSHHTVLLHGVTSSGKTEIYCNLIEQVLNRGEQALYLVPEIALTTQLTHRLQSVFGERVVVYHSKFTDDERVDIWKKMLETPGPWVILGARSSVFLPFNRLGLVIVDEEHETSYKQTEPAPRYNARDIAILLASMHGAKTLLGSATPSIETYYKATSGKFGLVELTTRFNDAPLPPVKITDLTTARKKKEMIGSLATATLRRINNSLKNKEQTILFRNRRGFAPIARCSQCAWIPKCKNCDVTLTYHNHSRSLVCHYCGTVYAMPDVCPVCSQPSIEVIGHGTERIEDDIEKNLPDAKILRMDLDTTRNKDGYEKIIDAFSSHKADILVGTQMVTKGLDFSDVSTVVAINADEMINVPEFKSTERAYNMLEQVAGRAGRKAQSDSEVIIQTYQPNHFIFEYLINHDYKGFYNRELTERRNFFYPPFSRVIYIYLRGKDASKLESFAKTYATMLQSLLGNRVSGPDQPKVTKVKNLYIQKIMLKIETEASMSKVRKILKDTLLSLAKHPYFSSTTVMFDVDP